MEEIVIVGAGGLESRIQQGNIDEPMGGVAFGPRIFYRYRTACKSTVRYCGPLTVHD